MEENNLNNKINKYLTHKPLAYGKKIYWSEFIAERVIQFVAFLSIAFIISIFIYVFHEASFAFFAKEHKTELAVVQTPEKSSSEYFDSLLNSSKSNIQTESAEEAELAGSDDLKPESYGDEDLKPQSYGDDIAEAPKKAPAKEKKKVETKKTATADDDLKPESYGDEDLKPQSYGSDETTSEVASSESNENETTDNSETNSENVESSLESGRQASLEMETVGEEKPVKVTDLIFPNDTIEGKESYIWQPIGQKPKYNLVPLALGAFKVTSIGLLIAAPIAILAAIFTVAFAPKWLREIVKPAIEILAGFPSVVIGFFCLITLASVIQDFFGITYRLNSFVGGIGMSLAVIPIIYTVTEDALAAVPKFMKEASLALGASKWQTAYRVLLPAATPGVFAAIILGFGRAFGETMIALMATGNAALVTGNLFDSVRTMSATIGAEMAEVEFQSVHYGVLFLIGAILFVVTFTLNAVAEFYVRKKLLKRFQGK